MKVAIVSPYAWTTPGGANAHIADLRRHLAGRGHDVSVIAPANGPADVTGVGRAIGIPFNGSVATIGFSPAMAFRVRAALRAIDPDVVHVHEPFVPSASILSLLAARAPVVATFHAHIDSLLYRAAGPALRPLFRRIAKPVAVSEPAASSVERVFGVRPAIVPNGVDCAAVADVPPPPPGPPTILYFGRLERRKGPQVLARAIPLIAEREPGARFVFAGDGPLRASLERALLAHPEPAREAPVAEEPARAAVTFTGRFTEQRRRALLAESTIVCLPAIGGESFGLTVVEAQAAGRPVVAAANPGYASVVEDGRTGVLVPVDDHEALAAAIVALIRDRARLERMGPAAREGAKRFDWPVVAGRIEAVYRQALGG
ncbi:MAG TPA: glycosyltransferase family 4 protein [Actinomycetota bacterium]